MAAATTVLFGAVTGAVADVALNDLSRVNDVARLRPYFATRSILGAAGAAAATVAIGVAAVLLATRAAAGFAVPRTAREAAATLGVSFAIGWAMDVAIHRMRVFDGLDAYYAAHGAGAWGGASLVVSVAVALAAQAYVLPLLRGAPPPFNPPS